MASMLDRRTFILATTLAPLALARASKPLADLSRANTAESRFTALEHATGGRLGVFALSPGNGKQVSYRANERFPFCSTFKFMLAAAILRHSDNIPGLQSSRIRYTQDALVTYSPITEKHIACGMTVAELCAAAIQYSDNGAANLLMKILGGPSAVTIFARSIGDQKFRLDRWETALNTAIPGDLRDTSTPSAMAHSFHTLTVGNALTTGQRQQLQVWLRGNTTGALRIKAGIPADWQIGDKTGSGDYGTTNDIAILWPPSGAPIIVAIFFTQREKTAQWDNATIAAAARIAVSTLR